METIFDQMTGVSRKGLFGYILVFSIVFFFIGRSSQKNNGKSLSNTTIKNDASENLTKEEIIESEENTKTDKE